MTDPTTGAPLPDPEAPLPYGQPPAYGQAPQPPAYGQAPPPPYGQAPVPPQMPYGQPPAGYGFPMGYQPKSKMVAGILGILLGSLGVHRFYLGYTGIGVLQLILTIVTLGFAGIWGFVEGIVILCTNDPSSTYGHDARGVPLTS